MRNSHRVGWYETTNDDAAAVMHIPHHGFADRIAAVANDGALRHRHPFALDRNPVSTPANVVGGAMAVGDVAARHAVRRHYALEPSADVGRHIIVLTVVER